MDGVSDAEATAKGWLVRHNKGGRGSGESQSLDIPSRGAWSGVISKIAVRERQESGDCSSAVEIFGVGLCWPLNGSVAWVAAVGEGTCISTSATAANGAYNSEVISLVPVRSRSFSLENGWDVVLAVLEVVT